MKKILIASSDAMMYQFLLKHAHHLSQNGWQVDIASLRAYGYEKQNYIERIDREKPDGSKFFEISATRSPLSLKNITGYKQLKKIITENKYDLVWCNEPVMGVLTRLAARKNRKYGMKVMYVTHGFHFYKGAPKLNWIVYYSIEKFFTRFTDLLVTVNKEDFAYAKENMKYKDIKYISGIGYNSKIDEIGKVDVSEKRRLFGIPEEAFLVLSVGELNDNKNHRVVIEALGKLKNDNIYYLVCGDGDNMEILKSLASQNGIADKVILPGFREDVGEIYPIADLYCFPSIREGLSVSMLEAMSNGLPIVCSDIRGNRDLIKDGEGGFLVSPHDADGFCNGIKTLYENPEMRKTSSEINKQNVVPYNEENAEKTMKKIVEEIL